MTHLRFAFIITLTILLCTLSLPAAEWQNNYDYTQVRQNFQQPPLWYAPHAFWFWDAPLDADLTASMAREMTRQRLNPGYAHPRHSGAPDKPYPKLPVEQWLSPLWFQSFDAALTQAEEAGMTLGYCDEYWWPSGQAAGRVLQQHPELAAQSLAWQRIETAGPGSVAVAACQFSVAAKLSPGGKIIASTLRLIGQGDAFAWSVPDGKWVVYSYTIYHHPGADGGQVNYLDNRLMEVFIPIAHQSYERHFADKMGVSIPGVFVDNEGDYGWKMAWSDYLAQRYRELKGRDIRLWLPLLTEKDADGLWAKARCDWFDVVSEVYSNQFLGRLSDWLAERNMYYISNLWEESLMLQTRAVGDFMRAQRRVTLPGNDCLLMKSQQVHDFKETQSVCEFEGRPFMSELMGVAGWEMTPAQMKMTLNSVTAFGVTHTVPHGINLNRKLETIPYPPDWFTENPYWRYLHLWTDFARRAAFVNRQGRLIADVLLYNPLKSVWALSEGYFTSELGDEWPQQAVNINNVYSEAMSAMTAAHLDYLIADDYYLDKAVVKKSAAASLNIAEHRFPVLALPPLFLLPRATAARILDFARAGGLVLLLGELPQGSPEEGASDPVIIEKMHQLLALPSVVDLSGEKDKMSRLVREINRAVEPQIIASPADATLFTAHRKIDDNDFYWLANNSGAARETEFSFRDGAGRAEIWNCENGDITPTPYKTIDDRKTLTLTLQPYEAFWLVFDADKTPTAAEQPPADMREIRLTTASLSFPETETIFVTSARSLIADADAPEGILNADFDDSDWPWMNIVGDVRLEEPWHAAMLFDPEPESKRYYRYEFILKDEPDGALINLNADNGVRFWVNGKAVAPGPHSTSWENVDLHEVTSMLRKGKNVIAVELSNRVGYGWLLMQGAIKLANKASVDILSSDDWKESSTASPGWQALIFDDSGWSKAQVAPPAIADKDMRTMKRPQKTAFTKATVWRRLGVPPTATKVHLPGLSPQARIWVDGKSIAARNEEVGLSDARMLVIKSMAGQKGLSAPAAFTCRGARPGRFGSWLDIGLRRFTGFMDYEMTVNAPQAAAATLDLGRVQYMAEVWVNGKHVGERLWPPFRFDVAPALRAGENSIRVRVGNVMANEMGRKDDLGELRHWGWRGAPPDSCFDAGLFGPVRLLLGH